jgi:lysophospholipase L1-like esterase
VRRGAFLLPGLLLLTEVAAAGSTSPGNPGTSAPHPRPAPEPRPVAIESPAALTRFFAALQALEAARTRGEPGQLVRILHFGDSHVAADWWGNAVRRRLQARYGDAGPGYVMPGRAWKYFHHERALAPRANWQTLGLGRGETGGFWGLSGVALAPRPGAAEAAVIAEVTDYEVQVGLRDGEACLEVRVDGAPVFEGWVGDDWAVPAPGDGPLEVEVVPVDEPGTARPVVGSCRRLVFLRNVSPLPPGSHVLAVDNGCGGTPLVLGMDLRTGAGGVLLDTLGLNGGELERLDRFDPAVRRALLAHASPQLIIISYGANDMTASGFTRAGYTEAARGILAGLRADAPGAAILVTGPTDRSHRRKGPRRELVRTNEPLIVAALRDAALASGCSFWDAREAMGGEGSIDTWRRKGLAGRDLVHLSEAGYVRLGELLSDALLDANRQWQAAHPSRPAGETTP